MYVPVGLNQLTDNAKLAQPVGEKNQPSARYH